MFDRENNTNPGRSGTFPETLSDACTPWSLLLPDAADGLLTDAEQTALDRHLLQCPACTEELAAARRGAAWLGLLKDPTPEPPPALLGNILAQTTGNAALSAAALPVTAVPLTPAAAWGYALAPLPEPLRGLTRLQALLARWFGLDEAFSPTLQPRLAMTGAMAFFSLCLTFNLLGLSLRDARAQVLHPAWSLQRTAADTGASLVRSFEGIRVVYRVESRVNEWRTASNQAPDPTNP